MPYAKQDPTADGDSSSSESQQHGDALKDGSSLSGSAETQSSGEAMVTPPRPSKRAGQEESAEDHSHAPMTPISHGSGSQSGTGFVTPGGWQSMASQSSCSCASCYCSDPSGAGPTPTPRAGHCPKCGLSAIGSPISTTSTSLESCSCSTCQCCNMSAPRGSPGSSVYSLASPLRPSHHHYHQALLSPSLDSTRVSAKNPPQHDGVWVRAVYVCGRLKEGSKLWTCCGAQQQLSLHCPSWQHREKRQAQVAEEAEREAKAQARRDQAKLYREEYAKRLAKDQAVEDFRRLKAQKAAEARLAAMRSAGLGGGEGEALNVNAKEPDTDDAMGGVEWGGGSGMVLENVPTLLSNMFRFMHVGALQRHALARLLSVCVGLDCGAGRVLVLQYRGLSALVSALTTHPHSLPIVLPCLQALAALTQDEVTRALVLSEGPSVLVGVTEAVLGVWAHHPQHEPLTQHALASLQHLAHDAASAEVLFSRGIVRLILDTCLQGYMHNKALSEAAIRTLVALGGGGTQTQTETLGTQGTQTEGTQGRGEGKKKNEKKKKKKKNRVRLLHMGVVFHVTQAMQEHGRHLGREGVLEACVQVLRLMCEERLGRAHFQAAHGLAPLLTALKTLWARSGLQEQGLLLVASLLPNRSLRHELDNIPGGWQWLGQGTERGSALLHCQPSRKHGQGPPLSNPEELEQHRLHDLQTRALVVCPFSREDGGGEAKDVGVVSTLMMGSRGEDRAPVTIRWTPHKFLAFLRGGGGAGCEVGCVEGRYYRLIRDLRLLPGGTESRGEWKERLRAYEAANGVDLAAAAVDYREPQLTQGQRERKHATLPPIGLVNHDKSGEGQLSMPKGFSHWTANPKAGPSVSFNEACRGW